MDQPVFWVSLVVIAVVALGSRLGVGRPLWRGRASQIVEWELVLAGVAVAALVFHCAAMFFAGWVDAVPFAEGPAATVRDLNSLASQAAYWVPALGLVIALRRVWLPALVLLVVTLVGVGYTMFVPHSLTTHLAWIAAATIALVMIVSGLVSRSSTEVTASAG